MAFMEWLIHETSIHSLITFGSRDIYLILLSRYLRMFAYGGACLVLGVFLWTAGNKGTQLGTFLTMTLLGDAVLSYLLSVNADKLGRRRVLMVGCVCMVIAGTVFFSTRNYYLLLFAAIFGVISPGAHEVGPFRAVQESVLAQLTPLEARTDIYAWFAVSSTLGMASGLCFSGWFTFFLRKLYDWDWKETYGPLFLVYAFVGLIKIVVVLFLTDRCEPDYKPDPETAEQERETTAPLLHGRRNSRAKAPTAAMRRIGKTVVANLSSERRGILIRLCFLLAINAFAQGMLPVTLIAWYANWRYKWFLVSRVGFSMALVWIVASIANLFSASVARRVGLVKAMIYTHLPNAIFLAFIPLASEWWMMLILLLISSAFGSMDQAPRAAFIAAVFSPNERTAVLGTINLVRTVASAGGPILTGYLHDKKLWSVVYVTAAILKILYDIGLAVMFLKTELPEHGRSVPISEMDVGILLHDVRPDQFEVEALDDPEMFEEEEDDEPYGRHGKVTYEGV